MANKIVRFSDWFDARNIEHVRAFKHLNTTGFWPEGFIPNHVEMSKLWQVEAHIKMSLCWLNHILPFDERIED